jgi:sulfate transport system ATP-binding protein
MSIEIRHIEKTFNQFKALRDLSLHIPTGELVALLGPSGCGKTTLLRIIAGLEVADSGSILFYGEDTTRRSVRQRRVGFVFQHYALFRHLTVFENVAFGLRVRPRQTRPSDPHIRSRVEELLNLVQMQGLANRYPHQLSGGQRQRIALARALAVEPKVLLLDEPFGALDTKVRAELRRWLRRLHDEMHITSVFVTHDQEEAMEVADKVVVMNNGKVEQVGTPDELYEHAVNPFVYQFLGHANAFEGEIRHGQIHVNGWVMPSDEHAAVTQAAALICVRPHDFHLSQHAEPGSSLQATLLSVQMLGAIVRLELQRLPHHEPLQVELIKEFYHTLKLQRGDTVYLKPRHARVFIR